MDNSVVTELNLESLDSGIPAITANQAGVHKEACVWCLLECGHNNGVKLKVEENRKHDWYTIYWTDGEIDSRALVRAYNKDDGPEHGAEAIALLLVRERTEYTAIRRSVTSTGIDYWLGYKPIENNQIFSQTNARLEVSGILQQSETNKPQYRATQKIKQTRKTDYTSFPAYVVIVEFSRPFAQVVCRNVTN